MGIKHNHMPYDDRLKENALWNFHVHCIMENVLVSCFCYQIILEKSNDANVGRGFDDIKEGFKECLTVHN